MNRTITIITALLLAVGSGLALGVFSGPFASTSDALSVAKDPVFYNELGYHLSKQGDMAGAQEAFLQALEIDESYENARKNLALSAFHNGEYALAITHLRILTAQHPQNEQYRFDLAQSIVSYVRFEMTADSTEDPIKLLEEAQAILLSLGDYPHASENAGIIGKVLGENE